MLLPVRFFLIYKAADLGCLRSIGTGMEKPVRIILPVLKLPPCTNKKKSLTISCKGLFGKTAAIYSPTINAVPST